MYIQRQRIVPNQYELHDLPFFKIEMYNLNPTITYLKMLHIRNITQKFSSLIAKYYAFWIQLPNYSQNDDNVEEISAPQIAIVTETPIISAQKLTYLYHDLLKQNKISKQQWNFVGRIEQFRSKGGKAIQQILMAQYQIKLKQKVQNITYNVYYDPVKDKIRVKGSLKITQFQVSASFSKKKFISEFVQGLTIDNKTVCQAIKSKYLSERMKFFKSHHFTRNQLCQFRQKYLKFYERQTKYMDEQILQLQVYHNFPAMRSKNFVPISFTDYFDGLPLVGPIFSNSNPFCMFGHFTGYNWNSCMQVGNGSICQICQIQIKQLKRNYLLEYLRDNVFNPHKNTLQYIAQYNRFRIMVRKDQLLNEQKIRKDIEKLKISEENQKSNMQQENKDEDIRQKIPILEITYTNYLHLQYFLKKTYQKNRMKFLHTKQVQVIKLNFHIAEEPARGKICQHLQFADLRAYYVTIHQKSDGFVSSPHFQCPICHKLIKDSELIYLREVVPAIKYLKKQMYDTSQQQYFLGQNPHKDRQIEANSAQIIINNFMQKVFVQFRYTQKGERHHFLEQIENLYPTLVDPYLHFSEYGLGIGKQKHNYFSMLDEKSQQYQKIIDEFDKKWYNFEAEKLIS